MVRIIGALGRGRCFLIENLVGCSKSEMAMAASVFCLSLSLPKFTAQIQTAVADY